MWYSSSFSLAMPRKPAIGTRCLPVQLWWTQTGTCSNFLNRDPIPCRAILVGFVDKSRIRLYCLGQVPSPTLVVSISTFHSDRRAAGPVAAFVSNFPPIDGSVVVAYTSKYARIQIHRDANAVVYTTGTQTLRLPAVGVVLGSIGLYGAWYGCQIRLAGDSNRVFQI